MKEGLCVFKADGPASTIRHVRVGGSSGRRIDLLKDPNMLFPSERHLLLRAFRYLARPMTREERSRYRIAISPGMLPVAGLDGRPLSLLAFDTDRFPLTSFCYDPEAVEALFCIEREVREILYQRRVCCIGGEESMSGTCSWCGKPGQHLVTWCTGDQVCVPCTLEREA